MANEGSTKPTYEELEAESVRAEGWAKAAENYKILLDAAEAELARVRGLLQRQWVSVEERLPEPGSVVLVANSSHGIWACCYGNFQNQTGFYEQKWCEGECGDYREMEEPNITHWMPLPTFPQSSSLVSQGAESADIGKLDGADENAAGTTQVGKLVELMAHPVSSPSVRERIAALPADETVFFRHFAPSVQNEVIHLIQSLIAGSAETGGEKAAKLDLDAMGHIVWAALQSCDHSIQECEPCRNLFYEILTLKVNQRLSDGPAEDSEARSGVEGAHEGTTADKSPVCKFCRMPIHRSNGWRHTHSKQLYCDIATKAEPFTGEQEFPLAGSREPEKLNNAQGELRRMVQNMVTYGRHLPNCRTQKLNSDGWCDCGFKDANRWALAESSLSSPPPTKDDSSAPKSPEATGLSIEPAEGRAPKETR